MEATVVVVFFCERFSFYWFQCRSMFSRILKTAVYGITKMCASSRNISLAGDLCWRLDWSLSDPLDIPHWWLYPLKAMFTLCALVQCPSTVLAGHICEHIVFSKHSPKNSGAGGYKVSTLYSGVRWYLGFLSTPNSTLCRYPGTSARAPSANTEALWVESVTENRVSLESERAPGLIN